MYFVECINFLAKKILEEETEFVKRVSSFYSIAGSRHPYCYGIVEKVSVSIHRDE